MPQLSSIPLRLTFEVPPWRPSGATRVAMGLPPVVLLWSRFPGATILSGLHSQDAELHTAVEVGSGGVYRLIGTHAHGA